VYGKKLRQPSSWLQISTRLEDSGASQRWVVNAGPEESKRAAIDCYSSQMRLFNVAEIVVPERFWRVRHNGR